MPLIPTTPASLPSPSGSNRRMTTRRRPWRRHGRPPRLSATTTPSRADRDRPGSCAARARLGGARLGDACLDAVCLRSASPCDASRRRGCPAGHALDDASIRPFQPADDNAPVAASAEASVLAARLQAEVEQLMRAALADAVAHLQARMDAELPAIVDRVLREVRRG